MFFFYPKLSPRQTSVTKRRESFFYKISRKEISMLKCTESDWILFWREFLHKREEIKNLDISIHTYIKLFAWSVTSLIECTTTNISETNSILKTKRCIFYHCIWSEKKSNILEADTLNEIEHVKKAVRIIIHLFWVNKRFKNLCCKPMLHSQLHFTSAES